LLDRIQEGKIFKFQKASKNIKMVSWLVIGILILLVLAFFKAKRVQHKFYTILLIFLLIFFYVSWSKVIAENNIDIKSFEGILVAGKLYFKWVGHVINNAKTLAGRAIKMDWSGNTAIK
jgi:hypothetical protein